MRDVLSLKINLDDIIMVLQTDKEKAIERRLKKERFMLKQ